MNYIIYIIILLVILALSIFYVLLKSRNIDIWFISYVVGLFQGKSKQNVPTHIMFCFVDHFEPDWGRPNKSVQAKRVDRWVVEYEKIASMHFDADGCFPKHTFFYPEEEYEYEYLHKLSNLCSKGYGEIEIHLHHDNDTEENFNKTMRDFINTLDAKHGAIARSKETNELCWTFIHGNWCLDNSSKDGRWCGLNNEITLLKNLNCYADFTLPAAPDGSQTKKINSIYYATDDPNKAKSHNDGVDVRVGREETGDLMLIQGPLTLVWKKTKLPFLRIPKIENSDIRYEQPPDIKRMDKWLKCNIHVKGKEDWVFVKIHTHGAQEDSMKVLLDGPLDKFFTDLEDQYNDGVNYILHYVTAREMYNIIKAAEKNCDGDPNDYRDYLIDKPIWKK